MAAKSSPWLPSSYIKSTGWSHLHTGRLLVSPRRFLLLLVSELCTCPVLRSLNCKHTNNVSQYLLCSKGILCKSYNFAAYKLIEIDTFMNGDKYAKLQNLILKGAPAGSLLMVFPDSLDHDCKVQQLNSSFQGRGKISFHLCCWNKK